MWRSMLAEVLLILRWGVGFHLCYLALGMACVLLHMPVWGTALVLTGTSTLILCLRMGMENAAARRLGRRGRT